MSWLDVVQPVVIGGVVGSFFVWWNSSPWEAAVILLAMALVCCLIAGYKVQRSVEPNIELCGEVIHGKHDRTACVRVKNKAEPPIKDCCAQLLNVYTLENGKLLLDRTKPPALLQWSLRDFGVGKTCISVGSQADLDIAVIYDNDDDINIITLEERLRPQYRLTERHKYVFEIAVQADAVKSVGKFLMLIEPLGQRRSTDAAGGLVPRALPDMDFKIYQ